MENSKKMSFFPLIFLTMAFFASVRRIPNIANAGWESVFFMGFSILFFVLPICFVSAKFATAMPKDGGLSVWIGDALSKKWGFVASFLVWIQMCFGMVTVGAAFADILATILGSSKLLTDNVFIGIVSIALFLFITFLIIKGVKITSISTYGTIFGLLVPLVVLLVAGSIYVFVQNPTAFEPPTMEKIFPNMLDLGTFANLSGIIFLFAGMEQASSFANCIDNPKKNYPKAILIATISIAVLFTYSGILTNGIINTTDLTLSDPVQVFAIIFTNWGVPWVSVVIAVMVGISCFTEISAWVVGPSRNMLNSAKEGYLPPAFAKTNKKDVPVALLLLQAGLVCGISVLFVVLKGTNNVFQLILTMAVVLYAIVYLLIIISGFKYRKQFKKDDKIFEMPGGKHAIWIWSIIGVVGILVVIIASFIPPATLPQKDYWIYILIIGAGVLIFTLIPYLIGKKQEKIIEKAKK